MRISDWSSDVCSSDLDAAKLDVSAYFVHAEVGYQFKAPWSPRVSVEYDLASGDKRGRNYGRFDSLYGPRRSDFGPTGIYGPLGRNNISSPGVRLEVKPDKRWDGFLRSEEHTSALQSLMRISYAVFCLKQNNKNK